MFYFIRTKRIYKHSFNSYNAIHIIHRERPNTIQISQEPPDHGIFYNICCFVWACFWKMTKHCFVIHLTLFTLYNICSYVYVFIAPLKIITKWKQCSVILSFQSTSCITETLVSSKQHTTGTVCELSVGCFI